MLEQTVSAILDAENKADAMVKDALDEAKLMVANAEEESEKIKQDTIKKVKEERKNVVTNALNEGDQHYAEILLFGDKQAKKLTEKTDIDKAVFFIKEKVLSKYGNS